MQDAKELQKQFETLRDLQDVLAKIFATEDEMTEIPKSLQLKEEQLMKNKKDFLEIAEKSAKAKDDIANLEKESVDAESSRIEYEKQMENITTQREFEALSKEIELAREKEQSVRKALLNKQKYISEIEERINEQEDLIKFAESEVSEESAKKDALLAEKQAVLDALIRERNLKSIDIEPALMFKFERIIRNKKGKGIVPVHGLVCQGCHMILPMQFVNRVRKSEEIEFCPYCSRILYYEDVEGADEQFMAKQQSSEAEAALKVDNQESEDESMKDFIDDNEFADI